MSIGYTSSPIVEAEGEFSTRGGIIDIFSPNHADPIGLIF